MFSRAAKNRGGEEKFPRFEMGAGAGHLDLRAQVGLHRRPHRLVQGFLRWLKLPGIGKQAPLHREGVGKERMIREAGGVIVQSGECALGFRVSQHRLGEVKARIPGADRWFPLPPLLKFREGRLLFSAVDLVEFAEKNVERRARLVFPDELLDNIIRRCEVRQFRAGLGHPEGHTDHHVIGGVSGIASQRLKQLVSLCWFVLREKQARFQKLFPFALGRTQGRAQTGERAGALIALVLFKIIFGQSQRDARRAFGRNAFQGSGRLRNPAQGAQAFRFADHCLGFISH